jgi:hypothetical protein
MTKDHPLTTDQAREIAGRMPQLLRAALYGQSPMGLNVCLSGVQLEELCHPLTVQQVEAVRRCVSFTRRDMEVTHLPNAWDAQEGLLTFRVRYDLSGFDADGNAVEVQTDGAIGLVCRMEGGAEKQALVTIRDVERCRLTEAGAVNRPGGLERRLRRWAREDRRKGKAETIGEFVVEALGAVAEIVLEAIFDG